MSKDEPTRFPKNAKKVFEGVLYDVYQWPQKLYDGTTVTYERINRQHTVSVLGVTKDHQILLVEEEQPHRPKNISLVAGKVDPGETPEEAAERELLEETGYKAALIKPWFEYEPDLNIDWTVFVFIAQDIEKVAPQNLEGGEKITPKLMTFDQFLKFAASSDFKATQIKVRILEALLDPDRMSAIKQLLTSSL
jgi:8-oxo-dGTP pyrophosphatase MutT (NUDIX family)